MESAAMPALDRPVLVAGAPRSGKSLVSRILSDAPEFHYVDEPLGIWDTGFGARPDDRRSGEDASDSLIRTIRGACSSAVAASGRSRYVDNLAYHALRIPFITRVMPDARIIHVTRRPESALPEMIYGWTARDTVRAAVVRRASVVRLRTLPRLGLRWLKNYVRSRMHGRKATWGPRVPGLESFTAHHSVALVAAYQWEQMVSIALDDLSSIDSQRWLDVRYERLLENYEYEVRRIAEFAGVADADLLLTNARKRVDPQFLNPYRVEVTEAELAEVRRLVQQTLQRLDRLDPSAQGATA